MHVDDMIDGGNVTFNRVMTAVHKEFDFGSWDTGNPIQGSSGFTTAPKTIFTDSESFFFRLDKVIRTAKVLETKIKVKSIPVEHLRFMGVHDASHANLVGI